MDEDVRVWFGFALLTAGLVTLLAVLALRPAHARHYRRRAYAAGAAVGFLGFGLILADAVAQRDPAAIARAAVPMTLLAAVVAVVLRTRPDEAADTAEALPRLPGRKTGA